MKRIEAAKLEATKAETKDHRSSRMARLLLSTILASGLAAPAFAQTAAPEPYRNTDEHGVDLVTGSFNIDMEEGSIGPANGGVKMVRYYGQSGYRDNWSGDLRKTMEGSVEVITINLGKISERFTKQGGLWVSARGQGATLTETIANAEFVYRAADGSSITYKSPTAISGSFDSTAVDMPGAYCNSTNALACGLPVESLEPSGEKYSLTWNAPDYCTWPANEPQNVDNQTCKTVYRLSDVRSNSGYAMKVKYQGNGTGNNTGVPPAWFVRSGLKFLDLSQVYCDPDAFNCDAVPGTWPTVTYSTPSVGVFQITNDVNGTWRLDSSNGTQMRIRRPGQASDTTIATFSGGRVTSIINNGTTQNYGWTTGATTTVTSTSGGGETSTTVSTPTVGQPVTETNGSANSTTYLYDANNRVTRETRPEDDYTNITYDTRGNVTEARNVAKSGSGLADIVSTANYDASCTNFVKCNKPNYTIDAKNNRTDYTYDATTGELTRVQLPAATTGGIRPEVSYGYSMLSAQIRDAGGTLYAQPAQAKLTQITSCSTATACPGTANETKVTFVYNTPNLLLTSVNTASGDDSISSTVTYTYDARDNLVSVDGPLAGSTDSATYIYDAQDRQRGVIGADPDGAGSRPRAAERYTFDVENRVNKVESGTVTAATSAALDAMAIAQTVDVVYDANGNAVRQTTSGTSGAVTVMQMTYDADNRLQCTAQRMNAAAFTSLPASACILGTQGSGAGDFGPDRIVQNSYDANGRVTLVKNALGTVDQANEVASGYTANGQLSYVTDAENNRTAYIYDGHGRLLQTRYPMPTKGANAASTTDYEQLGYDANGNVTGQRLRDGTNITLTYDNLNRVTLKDLPGTDTDVTYTYDLLGRPMTAATGTMTNSFLYDALSRKTRETGQQGQIDYQYDAAGRRTRITYPGATSLYVDSDYDVTGNVLELRENGATSGTGVLATYAYDTLGRRQSVTFGNGTSRSFSFDATQRLSSLTNNPAGTVNDQTVSFGYNPASQIASMTKSGDNYAWNGHYNVNRNYTSNGMNQLTATGATALGYDARGNLTTSGANAYTYSSENQLRTGPGGASLDYDPLGRLHKISATGAPAVTRFQYDGQNLIAEYAGSTLTKRYVHGPGIDEPILWYEGSGLTNKRYLMSDERGSVVNITDASGATLNINKYDEYGIPAATNIGRFGYTGQTWLSELGMNYYKARIYSPTLGRFMQADPIGYGDGMNMYNYVGGDPVNNTDSTGLSVDCGGDGEMPCGWGSWPQWMKESYCDQVGAVGCAMIDPTIEIGGKLYHLNNYSSYSKDVRSQIRFFYSLVEKLTTRNIDGIVVIAQKNPGRFLIDFQLSYPREQMWFFYDRGIMGVGMVSVPTVAKTVTDKCGNELGQNSIDPSFALPPGIVALMHTHPGWAAAWPAAGDYQTSGRFDVYGIFGGGPDSKGGSWVLRQGAALGSMPTYLSGSSAGKPAGKGGGKCKL